MAGHGDCPDVVARVGQIYVPAVNWGLMAATLAIVVGFGSSTSLVAAYGIAVTLTMIITALLLRTVAVERWTWPRRRGERHRQRHHDAEALELPAARPERLRGERASERRGEEPCDRRHRRGLEDLSAASVAE